MRKMMVVLALVLWTSAGFAQVSVHAAEAKPFITHKELDLLKLLPPPPADDAVQTKAELGEILTLQITRTAEMVERAQADVPEDIWRFSELFGASFNKSNLPKFSAFFGRVVATEPAVIDLPKKMFGRHRPHVVVPYISPVVNRSNSGSWPSGHATVGTLMGIVLSNMVPERRAQIMSRAWEYGNNRLVAGIHYRSDIEMGRIAGSLIALEIMNRDDFKKEFEVAKAELRAILGM